MQVVAIANDITYSSGSFGPREDAAFRAATEHALAERLPVVYLAANSGARVGLANEVKQCLQVRTLQHSMQRKDCIGWLGWICLNSVIFKSMKIKHIYIDTANLAGPEALTGR